MYWSLVLRAPLHNVHNTQQQQRRRRSTSFYDINPRPSSCACHKKAFHVFPQESRNSCSLVGPREIDFPTSLYPLPFFLSRSCIFLLFCLLALDISAVSLFVGRMGRRRLSPICGAFNRGGHRQWANSIVAADTPVTIFPHILAFRPSPRGHCETDTIPPCDIRRLLDLFPKSSSTQLPIFRVRINTNGSPLSKQLGHRLFYSQYLWKSSYLK